MRIQAVNQQSVKQSLERLRLALENGAPLSEDVKSELVALDADIQRALAGAKAPGLGDRVRELSLRFAQQHPTAAVVLRELGTLLEGIGA